MVFRVAMHPPELRRSAGTIGKGRRTRAEQGPRSQRNRDLTDHDGKFPDGPIKFPVKPKNSLFGRRREFPDTALKLLCYLTHMPRLRALMDRNSLYFPS